MTRVDFIEYFEIRNVINIYDLKDKLKTYLITDNIN